MQKWTPLTGINSYSDSSEQPKHRLFLDSDWGFDKHSRYCKQWQQSNQKQVEELTGCKISVIYCKRVGPSQYDLKLQLKRDDLLRVTDWFGNACCDYGAVAKALQDLSDCCYSI